MTIEPNSLSRIRKLLIDRDDVTDEEAGRRLAEFRLTICCGPEVTQSASLQAALLTAANVASRCFPGGVRVTGADSWTTAILGSGATRIDDLLADIAGADVISRGAGGGTPSATIALGTADPIGPGVQATFDGWTCAVSPIEERLRLPEREGCVLSGIAAGALAVSEIFLQHFGFDIEASSRPVGLSLWRPDLPWDDPDAGGALAPLRFLPEELWLIGLGHLGQSYAWSLSLLPFSARRNVNVLLQDFDRIVSANYDTGLLTRREDVGSLKSRVVSRFLEAHGFQTRCLERRFDEFTRPQVDEPRIALAGMDGQGPRHLLDQAGFDTVVDCGVGGRVGNFDAITLNVVPNASRSAAEIWPPQDHEAESRQREAASRLAETRRAYQEVQREHACGHVELAGRAVAVPFVGAVAATLALAEVARRVSGAEQYDSIVARLSSLTNIHARPVSEATANRVYRLSHQPTTHVS